MGIMIMKEKGRLRLEDKSKKIFPCAAVWPDNDQAIINSFIRVARVWGSVRKSIGITKIATNKDVIDIACQRRDTLFLNQVKNFQYYRICFISFHLKKYQVNRYNDFLFKYVFNPTWHETLLCL